MRKLVLRTVLLLFIASLGLVLLYRFVPVPITPLVMIRAASSVFQDKLLGMEKDWVPLEEIAPSMRRAVLMAEDYRFFEHNGFDFEAIEKAIQYNKTHQRKKGGSTISQQTAKNVFLWPSRSWVRKGLEVYFTVWIEAVWPKERILEVYLNVIEFGPGVYGVEAAAQKYFKRKAKDLNASQAALMAAVLPNPHLLRIDRPSKYVLSRQRRIMNRAAQSLISKRYKAEPISVN
ncbi:MAG: monofunctional biosynthetic peptidoglycan transglycosylase [Pseudobdellovibrionaceae bacterium]